VSSRTTERDERIRGLRADGRTLQEIADVVGVTRERVRQVLLRIGGPTAAEVRTTAVARRRADADAVAQRIWHDIDAHPGSTVEEVATRLAITKSEVHRHMPEDVKVRVVRRQDWTEEVYSEADILEALVVASTYAYPLSAGDYERLLISGEVCGPSAAQRFGNWGNACRSADVEPAAPRRGNYQSRWTDDDVLAFVRDYLQSPSSPGTFAGYDPWRRANDLNAPSSALLRCRLGAWSVIKRRALTHAG
jgi:predicted transcriptional regulator